MASKTPIGYVCALLDRKLTDAVNKVLAQHGLNRAQWQALNVANRDPENPPSLSTLTATLRVLSRENPEIAVESLVNRGLLSQAEEASGLTLTPEGRTLLKEALNTQQQLRERVTSGVSQKDYDLTISTLKTMIRNLE